MSRPVSRANRWGYVQCAMCDEWYPENDPERVKVHRHPEPQSGPPRDALLRFNAAGGDGYERWIVETAEGREWANMDVRARAAPRREGG